MRTLRACVILAAIAAIACLATAELLFAEACQNKCAASNQAFTGKCSTATIMVACNPGDPIECFVCAVNVPALKKPCEQANTVNKRCCHNGVQDYDCHAPRCVNNQCVYDQGQKCGTFTVVYGSCETCIQDQQQAWVCP